MEPVCFLAVRGHHSAVGFLSRVHKCQGVWLDALLSDRGIVNLIFSLDEFSPRPPISRDQSGMYEREKREEALLSRLFSIIISTILIKLTIPRKQKQAFESTLLFSQGVHKQQMALEASSAIKGTIFFRNNLRFYVSPIDAVALRINFDKPC